MPRASSRHHDPGFWRGAFIASDPDLARWHLAARATSSVAASALLLGLLASALHVPVALVLPGVVLAMTASITVNDPTPREQRRTMALMPLPALLGLALGTLLAPYRAPSLVTFLVVIFSAVCLRRIGPRGTALGMLAFISYFLSLFFQAPTSALPIMGLSVLAAIAVCHLVRFHLLPERPQRLLERCLLGLRLTVDMLLVSLADALEGPRTGSGPDRLGARALGRVNRLALTTEDWLGKIPPGVLPQGLTVPALRRRVFDVEIAAERLASSVARARSRGLSPGARAATARLLRESREGVPVPGRAPAAAAEIGQVLAELREAVRSLREPLVGPEPPPRAEPPEAPTPAPAGLHPTTRLALQATIATGLAMGAGLMISRVRWYWAVIGAYVMFVRATTLGETLVRGWHRVLGTAVGVLAGALLANWMAGHPVVEAVELFLALFLGLYFLTYSYLWMVVGITLLLAGLYLILGRYSRELLLLRLELTLVGCAIGGIVAMAILPAPTRDKVRSLLGQCLFELAAHLKVLLDHPRHPGRLERARQLDRMLRDLRAAASPLTGGLLWRGSQRTREALHFMEAARTFARQYADLAECLEEPLPSAIRSLGAQAIAHARAIAQDLDAQRRIRPPSDGRSRIEGLGDGLTPGAASQALYWLEQLDESLVSLGRSLS